MQHDVWTARHHVGRSDLYGKGVFVEFDGRAVRLQRSLFTPERRRQTRIAEAGHELRRFTRDDLLNRTPGDLVAEVRRAEVAWPVGTTAARSCPGATRSARHGCDPSGRWPTSTAAA